MAAKQYSSPTRTRGLQRVIVFACLFLLAGFVAWRIFFSEPKSPSSQDTPIASAVESTAVAALSSPPPTSAPAPAAQTPPQTDPPGPIPPANPQTPLADSSPVAQIPAIAAEPLAVPATPAGQAFQAGSDAFQAKDYIKARDRLSAALKLGLPDPHDRSAREMLNRAADEWLFSKHVLSGDPYCSAYTVRQGDLLVAIARKFSVPHELLMKINGIENPSRLRVGQTLKVVHGPFHVEVKCSTFQMTVTLGDAVARCYPVSVGKSGRDTPRGLWKVRVGKKQVNPAWPDAETGKYYYPDDPENPLGERWIGLEGIEGDAVGREGFGIHGTIKPDEIGKNASRGCIRLLNPNVEEVYDLLAEGNSLVRVID